jgi:hypothetical protein
MKLHCDMGDSTNVLQLVRHIWSIQLRRVERLAALPATALESIPAGPLDALFACASRGGRGFSPTAGPLFR